jgi:hypothetical protein
MNYSYNFSLLLLHAWKQFWNKGRGLAAVFEYATNLAGRLRDIQ